MSLIDIVLNQSDKKHSGEIYELLTSSDEGEVSTEWATTGKKFDCLFYRTKTDSIVIGNQIRHLIFGDIIADPLTISKSDFPVGSRIILTQGIITIGTFIVIFPDDVMGLNKVLKISVKQADI